MADAPLDLLPDQLPDVLDFLDATWRLAFKGQRLIQLRGIAGPATLAKACRSRGEFNAALSSLDDIFKSMTVSDDLLNDVERGKEENKGDKTLNRLNGVLRSKFVDPELGAGLDAIKKIRVVSDLRVAFQHSAKAQNVGPILEKLGLTITPDWAQAWDRIRLVTAGAVVELRRVVQSLAP